MFTAAGSVRLVGIVGGNSLNAAADASTNGHTQGKRDIADAALRLGRNRAMSWAAAEMTLALAVATAISLWLDRVLIVVGMALAIVLCLLCNLEPVRLKRRGLVNPIAIGLMFGPLSSLVSYSAVWPDLTVSVWLVFNGAFQAIVIACVVTVAGLDLLGWGLWSRSFQDRVWALARSAPLSRPSAPGLPNSTGESLETSGTALLLSSGTQERSLSPPGQQPTTDPGLFMRS